MHTYSMIIDGQAVTAEQTFDVVNPANGAAFARCAQADAAAVDRAVRAARRAFPAWSNTPDAQRQGKIRAIADALEAEMPDLMALVTRETGKPMGGLNGVGSGMEVGGAIAWARYNAELELPVEVIQDNDEARIELHRRPLGVVASITPWNWPLLIAIWHIIPALRAGNTVVMKPSPFTPLATIRLAEIANTVLPPGVVNIVTGGPDTGRAVSEHPDINKIIFTGSTPTGKAIMQAASAHLKRLTLELGGNDAGIVLADVDVKTIAPKLFGACFHNNGQTCACLKRLYVHDTIYAELCAELVSLAEAAVLGDGLDEGTELGPVQNHRQLTLVEEFADQARKDGGRVLCGGTRLDRRGYFFPPTIVADLSDGHRLVDEEPFGPILPIIKYRDIDEVIARANRSDRGLGGSVWSGDSARAAELALRLECGSIWVNEHGAIQPDAPFGGIKQSGIGVEFGRHGLEEYTSLHTLKIAR